MYRNVKLEMEDGCFVLRADSRRFGKNEIIFQSPLKDDLDRFMRDNKIVMELVDYSKKCSNLREREDKELLGYWRMYFRGGWDGRWFPESNQSLNEVEILGLDNLIYYVCDRWTKGCDYFMDDDLKSLFPTWGEDGHRFLLSPKDDTNYLVMIDTTFGNGDYPCRIYVYRDKELHNE